MQLVMQTAILGVDFSNVFSQVSVQAPKNIEYQRSQKVCPFGAICNANRLNTWSELPLLLSFKYIQTQLQSP
jgi:hypothetical protein